MNKLTLMKRSPVVVLLVALLVEGCAALPKEKGSQEHARALNPATANAASKFTRFELDKLALGITLAENQDRSTMTPAVIAERIELLLLIAEHAKSLADAMMAESNKESRVNP